MSEQDRVFIKNFALLIAGLAVFTVVMIVVGIQLNQLSSRPDNPDRTAALEARIAPVGRVIAGEAGLQAIAAAAEAQAAAAPAAAFDGSLDAEMIYNSVCAVCHTGGIAGSPKLVRADWDARIDQGMEVLVRHAIEGFVGAAGVMPARGGKMDLTDEQVEVTVQWMIDNLQ